MRIRPLPLIVTAALAPLPPLFQPSGLPFDPHPEWAVPHDRIADRIADGIADGINDGMTDGAHHAALATAEGD